METIIWIFIIPFFFWMVNKSYQSARADAYNEGHIAGWEKASKFYQDEAQKKEEHLFGVNGKYTNRTSRNADPEYLRRYYRTLMAARRTKIAEWENYLLTEMFKKDFVNQFLHRYPLGMDIDEIVNDIIEQKKYKHQPLGLPYYPKS